MKKEEAILKAIAELTAKIEELKKITENFQLLISYETYYTDNVAIPNRPWSIPCEGTITSSGN